MQAQGSTALEEYDHLYKLVIIGDVAVGKSSIIQRFINDNFTEDTKSTLGVDFKIKTIKLEDGKVVKIQIWDTGGQERYKAITSNYFRGAHGVLVVFDLTKYSTFEHIDSWVQHAGWEWNEEQERWNAPNSLDYSKLILVGNKSDMKNKRTVSESDAKEKAKQYGAQYKETSALNGFNVLNTFVALANELFECKQNFDNDQATRQTVALRQGKSLLEEEKEYQPKKKCCN